MLYQKAIKFIDKQNDKKLGFRSAVYKMNKKYMIIISLDAVSSKDIKILKKLPNISTLIDNGSLISNVKSIYPSLTYPAHVSIVTGKYPVNHGITNNTVLNIKDENPNWNWYGNKIKGDTLFDLAKKQGLKTCSIVWPVTGKMDIDYNMPEIFGTKPWHNQLIMSALAGSLFYQLNLNNKFGYIRKGTKEPYLDDFVTECTKYTIEKLKPNLTMIHLIDVDSHRHDYGYGSKEAYEALNRNDRRVGEIIESLKKVGIYDDTTIVLLGDHSAIDVHEVIRLNSEFKKEGLLKNDGNKIVDFISVCKECGGSAYIYINKKATLEDKNKVLEILNRFKKNGYIENILTREEAEKEGADSNCDYMLEATRGYYFSNEVLGESIEDTDNIKSGHIYKAVHGYSPKKEEYGTFFLVKGKEIREGVELNGGELINHAPTLGKILGLEFKNIDGKVEKRIFKSYNN